MVSIKKISKIKAQGNLIAPPPLALELVDPDDLKFIEVAVAARVKYLVTGNIKHYPKQKYKNIEILTPATFIKFL